jgi:hypothetical protein
VNGSLHSLQIGEEFFEPPGLYRLWPPAKVVREYLAEIIQMVRGSDLFGVLAHIGYAVDYWPSEAGPFDPSEFSGPRQGAGVNPSSGKHDRVAAADGPAVDNRGVNADVHCVVLSSRAEDS